MRLGEPFGFYKLGFPSFFWGFFLFFLARDENFTEMNRLMMLKMKSEDVFSEVESQTGRQQEKII